MENTETRKNRSYPWEKIKRGQCMTITMKSKKAIKSAINAAYGWGQRNGVKFTVKRFVVENPETGERATQVKIWRIV